MDVRSLYRQMANYDAWKTELQGQLLSFKDWLKRHRITGVEANHCLNHSLSLLHNNEFTLVCVGEFSRGKTELINALLYAEYGQRVLPSRPGRTTMCPTEIFYDGQTSGCCVRLLPIETRRSSSSIESFRRIPNKWVTIYFDPRNPHQVEQAVSQISASKRVTVDQAKSLGFESDRLSLPPDEENTVEIPAWRHALINLDHDLLRQGLRIIDTPGLNAFGNEPELTLSTLPHADAVIFLLSADAGVSASDMAIWNEHIDILRENNGVSVLVLLNKIDALWNDTYSPDKIADDIRKVRETTARQLRLPIQHVVPISAKEGLLAKATHDKPRLLRSSLLKMEMLLAEKIVDNQRAIINHRTINDIMVIINNTYKALLSRNTQCRNELELLQEQTSTKGQVESLGLLRRNIRITHTQYHKQALSLRSSQRLLERQKQALLAPVSPVMLDQLITNTTEKLKKSWTTIGLSKTMAGFFEILEHNLDNMARETEQANRVLMAIYERQDNGDVDDDMVNRHLFSIKPFKRHLAQLQSQTNTLKLSLNTLFASKQTIIARFIQSLVREVRNLYVSLNEEVNHWVMEALTPLTHHNLYQKQLLERHMLSLTNLTNDNRGAGEQIQQLQQNLKHQEGALTELEYILRYINQCTPVELNDDNVIHLNRARQVANR